MKLNKFEEMLNRELYKIAINARYGSNRYMPEAVSDAIKNTDCLKPGRYPWGPSKNQLGLKGDMTYIDESFKNNIIMEDTDMLYALTTKMTSRGGPRWLAALEPKKIHFNGPATIVEWNDGTKTVVKCQKGDTFDPLTGVAMACMKKMLGTNASGSNYLNDVSKLIDEAWEAMTKRYKKKEFWILRKQLRKNTMEFELNKQAEMEFCSNLITTMANKNATEEEIKRVILYSMAVDATKTQPLTWGEARAHMGIDELAKKYQEDKRD